MNPSSNSPELQAAKKMLRYTVKPMLRYLPSQRFINWLTHMRKPVSGPWYDAASREWISLGTVKTLRVTPDVVQHDGACILYFHGGAYTIGSPASSEPDARRLAISCGTVVYSAKYTKAIHAPYPAAVNDAEIAYKVLLAKGFEASQIVLAGTSAGAGLALALLHRLLAQGDPLPKCVVTLSAWMDLTMSYPSIDALSEQDDILTRVWITRAAKMYGGELDRKHPEISPGFGDFTGAPPILLLYSKAELFRDEIEAFEAKLRAVGVEVEIMAHENAPHAWPTVAENVPETEAAFQGIAGYVAKHLSNP